MDDQAWCQATICNPVKDYGLLRFWKRGFGKDIYRMISRLSLQSRAYFDLATLVRYTGSAYLLNKLSRWMFEGFRAGFLFLITLIFPYNESIDLFPDIEE